MNRLPEHPSVLEVGQDVLVFQAVMSCKFRNTIETMTNLGKNIMEAAQLLCLSQDLELDPYMVKVRLNQACKLTSAHV
jgi:hypothetical protein